MAFFTRCAREYGDVAAVRIWKFPALLFSRPDLIEQVLVSQAKNFTKHFGLRIYKPLLGEGLLISEGSLWRRQRKLSAPAFQASRLAKYAVTMVDSAQQMLGRWPGEMETDRGETRVRDVHVAMMRLTLEIACKTLFGADACPEPRVVGDAMHGAMEALMRRWRWAVPLPGWLPTLANWRLKKSLAALDGVITGLVESRRRGAAGDDLLWTLLEERDEEGSAMTQRQLVDEARTMLLAGFETTALALSYSLLLLAMNPVTQKKLQEELAAVVGGRAVGWSDLPRLEYTRKVIVESMRIYPPADVIGREAISDCMIGEVEVPKGMTIFVSLWAMHHDGRYFPEPEKFDPDRWTEAFEKQLPRFAYLPFGGGPRSCIGQSFATAEAVLLLATICQRLEFGVDPTFELELRPLITLRPEGGVRLQVTARALGLKGSVASAATAADGGAAGCGFS